MEIKILCPLWGHEQLDITTFAGRVKDAGYDGIDGWIPEDAVIRAKFFAALRQHQLALVVQQHQAGGESFDAFKASFLHYLQLSAEGNPLLINSHTGRDYFSFDQNLELLDLATAWSERQGIAVVHEIHRGRFSYSPAAIRPYLDARPGIHLTADFSHWVCVTESWLENHEETLQEAIQRSRHIHARVGYEEGPQVPDPRAPEWQDAVEKHLLWWDRIVEARVREGAVVCTFTTEFGPPPYLQVMPFTKRPVADQFDINCYMKDLLSKRYRLVRHV